MVSTLNNSNSANNFFAISSSQWTFFSLPNDGHHVIYEIFFVKSKSFFLSIIRNFYMKINLQFLHF